MRIRCWGARGSIPVSGAHYVRYGGDTTCLELRSEYDEILVIDAGSGIRRLGNSLLAQDRLKMTMLFTHAHWDHILGFPFFKPIYAEGAVLTVHGLPKRQGSMAKHLSTTMVPPYFPVPLATLKARISYQETDLMENPATIQGLHVSAIPLSHPNMGLGYAFEEEGRRFVFLTDNELGHEHRGSATRSDYVAFCKGADLLIHDAEYTSEDYAQTRGWGHSLYTDALELALEAGVKRFGLFHHNQDRTDDAVDAMVLDCKARAKAAGADLEIFALTQETEIVL